MNYQHLMIDLETLGRRPGCVIVQIGACLFNTEADTEVFCESIDIQTSINAGLYIDGSTLSWWMRQSDEARKSVFDADPVGLSTGVSLMMRWLGQGGLTFLEELQVWSHGLAFDIPILEHVMGVLGTPPPWSYKNLRDTRTLAMLCPQVERPKPAVAHDAGEDARAQAIWVASMLNAIDAPSASGS